MSDRYPAEILIGGTVPQIIVAELIRAIVAV